MMKTKWFVAGACLLATGLVSATPITGEFGMIGSFTPVNSGWDATDLASATGVDFNGDVFRVTSSASGSFEAVAGRIGSIKDFQFDPLSAPVIDFWTVGDFSFDMTSVEKLPSPDPTHFLFLEGTGVVRDGDGDAVAGSWSFSGNGSSGTFSWSAGVVGVHSVPEPATLALLGAALGLLGRRRERGRQ